MKRWAAISILAGVLLAHFVGPSFDRYGRLSSFPGKISVSCPPQTARTAIILALGQSNISNDMEPPATADASHPRVVNFFEGQCAGAVSPLLGATGVGGEWLTLLGDALIRSGRYDAAVIAPGAVAGQLITRFAKGDLGQMIDETASTLALRYRVTHVIWHQGEWDFLANTEPEAYRAMFLQIVDRLRRHGVDAPIFVSTTTYCPRAGPWRDDNAIQKAQRSLPNAGLGVFAGVDTDAFDQTAARFDACHLSRRGQEWAAAAEAEILLAHDLDRK